MLFLIYFLFQPLLKMANNGLKQRIKIKSLMFKFIKNLMNLEEIQVNSQVMFYKFVAFILLQVSELQIAQRLQEDILYLYRPGRLFKIVLCLAGLFLCLST